MNIVSRNFLSLFFNFISRAKRKGKEYLFKKYPSIYIFEVNIARNRIYPFLLPSPPSVP